MKPVQNCTGFIFCIFHAVEFCQIYSFSWLFCLYRYGRNIPRYDFVGSEDCDVIEDGCMQYLVKKTDHSLDCFTGDRLLYDINQDKDSSLQSLIDLFLSEKEG